MPALFVDRADAFQVLLARGVVDSARPRAAVSTPAWTHPGEAVRLRAAATRLIESTTENPFDPTGATG